MYFANCYEAYKHESHLLPGAFNIDQSLQNYGSSFFLYCLQDKHDI